MEDFSLIKEICYILSLRNEINNRRSKARYSMYYYETAANNLKAFLELNNSTGSSLSKKDIDRLTAILKSDNYRSNISSKVPVKHLKLGVQFLLKKALRAEKKYVKCKLETYKLTKKYHNRILFLLKKINAFIVWDNGYAYYICFRLDDKPKGGINRDISKDINRSKIDELAVQHRLDLEISKLLK